MQVHKETMQAELKMVREDIHRVTLELTEHQQRVEKLHAKHDVLVSRNATPDGEIHSQVNLMAHTALVQRCDACHWQSLSPLASITSHTVASTTHKLSQEGGNCS